MNTERHTKNKEEVESSRQEKVSTERHMKNKEEVRKESRPNVRLATGLRAGGVDPSLWRYYGN